MRFASVALFLLTPSFAACVPSGYWVGGTVDYAMASPAAAGADRSGALPLRVLYCPAPLDYVNEAPTRPSVVRLGEACVLDLTHGGGTCDLPSEGGPLRVAVENVSAALTAYGYRARRFGSPLNVVVGGTSVTTGRYLTYRFTGGDMQPATDDQCAAAARGLPTRAPPVEATSEVSDDSWWSAWRDGKLDLPSGDARR